MTARQQHGFTFEQIVSSKYVLSGFSHSKFDICPPNDTFYGSIKCVKDGMSIGLADARTAWQWPDITPTIKFIIGCHKQKILHTIYEIDVELAKVNLYGNVSFQEITNIHNNMQQYMQPNSYLAQEQAKKDKAVLKHRLGIIDINPKIDSKTQRRLQGSTTLQKLLSVVEPTNIVKHTTSFEHYSLPHQL